MNKQHLFPFVAAALIFALPAFAQTQNANGGVRQNARKEVQRLKQTAAGEITAKRQELEAMIKQKRDEFQKAVAEKQKEVKAAIDAEKKTLEEKLKKIKDGRKKATVQQIDTQLNDLNARMLKHYSDVLDNLENILGRISSRADKAAANGKDVSTVKSAVTDAHNAIAGARSAITVQTGKTYPLNITTENGLKQAVGQARQALHADLKKVQDAVFSARSAVQKAATTLAKIPDVDKAETSTSTPTSAPSSQ